MLNACIRCSTIFVGLVSLIQAITWAGFSIWGIAIYGCTAEVFPLQSKVDNFHDISKSYLFYLSYLRGSCRNSDFYYVSASAERTYKFLLAYSILSSIWVPASVLLLVGTCLGARGVKAKWIYSPYIFVTISCCLLDVVATAYYAIDISHTMTTSDYMQFLNMPPNVQQALGMKNTQYTYGKTGAPAIVMTVIASRCVVLWLLNAFFVAFGLQGLCAFSKPSKPKPYNQSSQYIIDQQQPKQIDGGWIPFQKDQVPNQPNPPLYPTLNGQQHTYDSLPREPMTQVDNAWQPDSGRINPAYVIDEPLRLNPVEVEVKQERNNVYKEARYAEVAEIQMEPTPQEIRHTPPKVVQFERQQSNQSEPDDNRLSDFNSKLEKLKKLGLIVPVTEPKEINSVHEIPEEREVTEEERGSESMVRTISHVSQAESVLEDTDDVLEDVESIPPASSPVPSPADSRTDSRSSNNTPRRVYDVHGNPTEERLTPKISRIQKIIERHMAANHKGEESGINNNRPFSYIQPQQPQIDNLPKKNDTVRGLDKPPIPVPDYSVRVTKSHSFRTPLPSD